MDADALSRVLQGLVAGIGFLGAGTVLKFREQQEVRGLTTAASVWATAGIGVACGIGREGTAILATLLVLFILAVLLRVEKRFLPPKDGGGDGRTHDPRDSSSSARGGD